MGITFLCSCGSAFAGKNILKHSIHGRFTRSVVEMAFCDWITAAV